jgi:hypothetical protein
MGGRMGGHDAKNDGISQLPYETTCERIAINFEKTVRV